MGLLATIIVVAAKKKSLAKQKSNMAVVTAENSTYAKKSNPMHRGRKRTAQAAGGSDVPMNANPVHRGGKHGAKQSGATNTNPMHASEMQRRGARRLARSQSMRSATNTNPMHAGENQRKDERKLVMRQKAKERREQRRATKLTSNPMQQAQMLGPPSADANATHPRGWIAKYSASSNATDDTNTHTGKKTRKPPTLPAPPAGWTVHAHAEHGQYYHNASTNETRWTHPHDDEAAHAEKRELVPGAVAADDDVANPMYQPQALDVDAAARQGGSTTRSAAKIEVEAFVTHPRGWIETHSRSQNMPYYTNEHTGETVWTKPTLPAPPAGWTVHAHGENGEYYHNESTRATLWEHPHDEEGAAAGVGDSAQQLRVVAAASGEGNNAPSQVAAAAHPRGWTESFHPTHQRPLYMNDHTGEKVWEKPTLSAPPAGWTVHAHDQNGEYYHNKATGETLWEHPHGVLP